MEVKRKNSKKRQAIMDALSSVTEHPTAEMLYNKLKPLYPELSLGTVYRNLSLLADEGLIVRVAHVDGHERYDARIDPHSHFVCRCCHRVEDLELGDMISPLYAQVNNTLGCCADGYVLNISGLCSQCKGA